MTIWDILQLALAIVLPVCGVMVALLKWGLRAERSALQGNDESIAATASGNAALIEDLRRKQASMEVAMQRDFVRRDDWVPHVAIMESRIENLTRVTHELVGVVRSLNPTPPAAGGGRK